MSPLKRCFNYCGGGAVFTERFEASRRAKRQRSGEAQQLRRARFAVAGGESRSSSPDPKL